MTLLLEKIEEKLPAVSRSTVEESPEDSVNLKEDITPPLVRPRSWQSVRQLNAFTEQPSEIDEEVGGTVRIVFDEARSISAGRSPLRRSLEALSALRSHGTTVDWLEAAAVLKRDVVRLRDTNYSRHAAVLLALADALAFTQPAEIPVASDATLVFSHALGLLSEPYIPESDEEEFLGELLMAGLNLAPSEEQALEPVN